MSTPTVIDVDRLADLAGDVLTAAVQILDEAGSSIPARQYVAPGRVTHWPGCEALAVAITHTGVGTPGQEQRTPARCYAPAVTTLEVHLLRCVPTITDSGAPSAATLDASGRSLAADGWLLIRGFQTYLTGVDGPLTRLGAVIGLDAIRAEGGIGGWILTLQAQP